MEPDSNLRDNTPFWGLQLAFDLETADEFVVRRSTELVQQLVELRGRAEPPFLAKEFASLQGVNTVIEADLGDMSGVLLKSREGYIMKLNTNHHPLRQNFSCAHEVGHTILHELNMKSCANNAEFRMRNSNVDQLEIERLCDTVAAELLMPEQIFLRHLSSFDVSVSSIERMARTFKVSIPSAAIRIAELCAEPCIALLWKPWRRKRSSGFRFAWAAGPGKKTSMRNNCVPEHTYIRGQSILTKAYDGMLPTNSRNLFKIGNTKKRCYMESKGFGTGQTRYVMSLAFPER